MGRGMLLRRRDRHQSDDIEFVGCLAVFDKGGRLLGQDSSLLRLCPCVHLHIDGKRPILRLHFFGEGKGNLWPVDGLNHIEQGDGVFGFVGLKRADEPKFGIGEAGFEPRPLGLALLDPVFSEHAVACIKQREDRFCVERFGHSSQTHIGRLPSGFRGGRRDLLLNGVEVADRLCRVHGEGVAEFRSRVIALSRAAWSLRRASPQACDLPFALALFTDPVRTPSIERLATELPRRVPPVAVIFRHDALLSADRIALAEEVRREVQSRGHLFFMARGTLHGANGTHAHGEGPGLHTFPAHNFAEARRAEQKGADALFVSPVMPTDSHPGGRVLGPVRAARLAAASRCPSLALGGMDERSVKALHGSAFQGFGAIGAFLQRP